MSRHQQQDSFQEELCLGIGSRIDYERHSQDEAWYRSPTESTAVYQDSKRGTHRTYICTISRCTSGHWASIYINLSSKNELYTHWLLWYYYIASTLSNKQSSQPTNADSFFPSIAVLQLTKACLLSSRLYSLPHQSQMPYDFFEKVGTSPRHHPIYCNQEVPDLFPKGRATRRITDLQNVHMVYPNFVH